MDFALKCKPADQHIATDATPDHDTDFEAGLRDGQALVPLDMRRGHRYASGWLSWHWMKPASPRRH